jgi:hypothetical protein
LLTSVGPETQIEGTIAKRQKERAKHTAQFAEKEAAFGQLEAQLTAAQRQRDDVALGMSASGNGEGPSKTFAEQLRDAELTESQAGTEMQQVSINFFFLFWCLFVHL